MALTLKSGAEDIVIRARNGDQNAMGMIAEVRKAAKAGNAKAQMGFEAIRDYIARNPTKENRIATERDCVIGAEGVRVIRDLKKITKRSLMGAEGSSDEPRESIMTCLILLALPKTGGERTLNAGTVALANGPKLDDKRIRLIGEGIKDEDLRSFFYENIVRYVPSNEAEIPPQLQPIATAGQVVGQARALQIARLPNSPVSLVSPQVGWELGERQ